MKILLITREFPPQVLGGVAYHSYNLAQGLRKLDHHVKVLTASTSSHKKETSDFNLNNLDVVRVGYPDFPAPRLWFNVAVKNYIKSNKELTDVDLIHSHEFINFSDAPKDLTTVLKIHYNLTEKHKYLAGENLNKLLRPFALSAARYFLWPVERSLELSSLKSTTGRIYNSRLTRRIYESRYHFNDDCYEVIHNGVDLTRFDCNGGNKERNEKYFLFAGGVSTRKGLSVLISSLNRFNLSNDFKMKIVGDISSKLEIVQKAKKDGSLEFLGRLPHDELVNLYQNAIALIHPALYEPFGNVILESLACGTPVIISNEDHCGAAEILTDDCGIKIDPQNPSELADAMQYVADNPYEFKAKSCRKLAERYPWERVATETIKYVKSLR